MGKKKKWYQYVSIQAAFIIAIGGIIVAGINIWNTRSKLFQDNIKNNNEIIRKDETINTLQQQLSQKTAEIQHLETQLTPFKTIALEKYTGSEQEALSKFADELERLKNYINPLKKSISDARADVSVVIKSEEKINAMYATQGGFLAFVKDGKSLLLLSDTSSRARQNGNGEILYTGNFKIHDEYSEIGKPVAILREADIIQIEFNTIPNNSSVLGGRASVIINGEQRFDFEIPPQQMEKNKIIIRGIKNKF